MECLTHSFVTPFAASVCKGMNIQSISRRCPHYYNIIKNSDADAREFMHLPLTILRPGMSPSQDSQVSLPSPAFGTLSLHHGFLHQGPANISWKGAGGKYLRLHRPNSLYHSYSTLLLYHDNSHQQYIKDQYGCFNKTLFNALLVVLNTFIAAHLFLLQVIVVIVFIVLLVTNIFFIVLRIWRNTILCFYVTHK